jgi:hypothetical protein
MQRLTATVLFSMFLASPAVYAERAATTPPGIRASAANVRFDDRPAHRYVFGGPTSKNSTAQRASAAFAMGFLGTLAGAWVGAKLEGNCACDDPGLKGALIGMPIGAALGAIIGWQLSR